MKRYIAGIVAISVVIGLGVCRSAKAKDFKKLSLDDPSSIGLKIDRDAAVKVEGKASLKITTARPTTVCLGEVTGLNVEEAKLLFKAKVKNDIEDDAFLEMWVQVGSGQYFSKA